MLKFLNPQDPQATVSAFENYLAEKRESFSRTTKARLILGGLTTIVLILVLCFEPDSRYISIMAFGLVFVVLLSMLVSWTLMQDAMMFQDLKHTMRNYPSEIS